MGDDKDKTVILGYQQAALKEKEDDDKTVMLYQNPSVQAQPDRVQSVPVQQPVAPPAASQSMQVNYNNIAFQNNSVLENANKKADVKKGSGLKIIVGIEIAVLAGVLAVIALIFFGII